MANLQKCSKCKSEQELKYFSNNKKGQLYKTCDKCRMKRVQSTNDKDKITDAIKLMLKDKAILGCKYEGVKFDCGSKKGFVAATLYKGLEDEAIKQEIENIIGNP